MIRKILILALSSAISAAVSYGAWEKVDDFEDYADQAAFDAVWTKDNDTDGEGGGGSIVADPVDSGNKAMQFDMGMTTAESGTYNVRLYRAIPEIAPSSGLTTFYFRFGIPPVMDGDLQVPGVIDVVWGLSPVDDPVGYSDYAPLGRQEFNQSFDIYDTSTYVEKLETLPGETWYEMWWVVDTDNRTVDVHIRGGDTYASQTLVAEDHGWRNQTLEALDRFLLTSSAGTLIAPKGLDAMLIDDIYVSAGEELSSPIYSTGGWAEIDDFEGYPDQAAFDAVWTKDNDTDGEGGGGTVVDDPYASGNNVMQVNMGMTTAESGTYNVRLYRAIHEIAPSSGLTTFYFRFGIPAVMDGDIEVPGVVDLVWGLSPVDDPSGYSDYAPLGRQEFNQSFDIYDTDTYMEKIETLPGGTWYEMWWVVDTDDREVDVHIKGGDTYPGQTLVAEDHGWRNQTLEALDRFLLTTSAGTLIAPKGLDAMLIDDIYLSPGKNLSTPSGGGDRDPLIGGTPVEGLPGWFLSDWFGYYNTTLAPWIYHAEHTWLYRDPQSSETDTYFYDDVMATWWWTNETDYPSLYLFDPPADLGGTDIDSAWLWYFEDTKGPRWFSVLSGPSAGSFLSFNP